MAVSCVKPFKGVKEIKQTILETARKRKYVGQQVPSSYVILSKQVQIYTEKVNLERTPPIMVSYTCTFSFYFIRKFCSELMLERLCYS